METYQKQSSALRWGLTAVLAGLIALAGNVCGFAETGAETVQGQSTLGEQGLEKGPGRDASPDRGRAAKGRVS